MKSFALVLVAVFIVSGCAALKPKPLTMPFINIMERIEYSDLPQPIRNKVQLDDSPRLIRIMKTQGFGSPYYDLEFDDGSERRYNPDGSITFRGLI